MSKSSIIKIIIVVLFALAVALGIAQRSHDSEYDKRTQKSLQQHTASDKSLEQYYQESQQLATTPSGPTTTSVSFLAVGDIMLSGNVATTIQKQKDRNGDYPFQKMAAVLKSTNFNFANLESPFVARTCAGITGGHSLVFGAACVYIQGLTDYNFKILNLANNHAMDQGSAGLIFTKGFLHDSGIQTEGTGANLDEAWQPAIVNVSGLNICVVGASFSSLNDSGKVTNNYVARIDDLGHLKSAVATAKSHCDFIVATMHAGTEYTRNPNQAQVKFAHAAIDYGADMVIGAHPHWVQTIEKYCPLQPSLPQSASDGGRVREGVHSSDAPCANPKYIFYSLGNFVFDQEWSQDTKEGLALKISVSKIGDCSPSPLSGEMSAVGGQRGCLSDLQGPHQPAHLDSIQLIPTILENSSTPRPATDSEAKKILGKIGETETILYP